MNRHDLEYMTGYDRIMEQGRKREDRTGTGTLSLFGMQLRFDISKSFPLLTTKKVHWPSIVHELLWFLKGDTNIGYLNANGVRIWNEWSDGRGNLGPVYGAMWRSWPARDEVIQTGIGELVESKVIDQIAILIENLRKNPFSRRHIISAWNPELLPDETLSAQVNVANGKQALPPCHTMFQFYVTELTLAERMELGGITSVGALTKTDRIELAERLDNMGVPRLGLSCQLYQRSGDYFLGVPFNIASYSLLVYLIANTLGMQPLDFVWTGGDVHIYKNHHEQMEEQRGRLHSAPPAPSLKILTKRSRVEDYTIEDIELVDYAPMAAIKGKVAV